jgi:hypothetical protein
MCEMRWSGREARMKGEKKRGGKGEGYSVWNGVTCARSAHRMRKKKRVRVIVCRGGKGEGYSVWDGVTCARSARGRREKSWMRGIKDEIV